MANEVNVKFGAQLEKLIEGVNQAKEAIESIKETTDRVTEGFKSLAEIAGISLSIEGIKSFVESMAELGSRTTDSMARLGQSAEQVTTLQGVASVAGMSFESLQASIEKAALTVQKSTKDGYNPAAQALKVLGLNARSLTGVPADQWFNRIADAVSKFNPSLNLTSAVTAAFGRGAAQMLPLLLQGKEHFEELSAAVKKAQEGLAAAIPGMDDTHEKIALMTTSIQSLGARIFSVLKPAIDSAITWFTAWVQSIDTKTIVSAVNQIVEVSTEAILSIGNMALSLLETFATVSGGLDPLIKKLEVLALGGSIGASLAGVRGAIAGAGIAAAVAMFAEQYQKIPTVAEQTNVNLDAQRQKLASIVASIKASFSNLNISAPEAGAPGEPKQNAGAIDAGAKNELAAQASKIEAQIAAEQAKLERIKTIFSQEADAYKITEQQKAISTETAIEQIYGEELRLVGQKIALYGQGTREYEAAEKEKVAITGRYSKEMLTAVQESQKQMTTSIASALQTFTGAFNSQLRGLLAGTTSWATAVKNIGGDLFMKLIEFIEQWAIKHAAALIADSVLQKTQAASQVVTQAAAEAAKTEASVAGAAARASADASGSSVSIGTEIAAALSSIGASVARVFAGLTAALVPVLGPAAPAGALAISAGVGAAAVGMIHKFDVGTNYVLNDGLAMIHKGETIVPAQGSGPYTGGQGGGGSMVFAPNFSGFIGTQAMISQIMPQLARGLRNYQNLNPSTA